MVGLGGVSYKKKTNCLYCNSIVTGALGVMFFMLCNSNQPHDIKEFSLLNYQWEIETLPSDKNVGQIDDANTAIEKAKKLWIEKFSIIDGKPYASANRRKFEVSYDSKEECWHINGALSPNTLGWCSTCHYSKKRRSNCCLERRLIVLSRQAFPLGYYGTCRECSRNL